MNFKFFIVIFGFTFLGCRKSKEDFSFESINGHAATGLEIQNSIYHDNSKEGVEFALSMDGCDGVEIDIQLSKNNTLWLYHDVNLNSETNGDGCIPNSTDDNLNHLTYKTVKKEKLAKLGELDPNYFIGKNLFIDIRHSNGCESTVLNASDFIEALNKISYINNKKISIYILLSIESWISIFKNHGFTVLFSANTYEEYDAIEKSNILNDGVIIKNKWIS
ncbi:MAG: hypothetical protein HYR91_12545, partial [Flavobacteriia bacterium]|nr:hypothetical protein [Flavobacteriia bacterium]